MLWVTDLGWIMGPWTIVAAGVTGVHICMAEGSPMFPASRLWESAERNRVSVLGVGPSLVRGMMAAEKDPAAIRRRHDLSTLRVLGIGGEPTPPTPTTGSPSTGAGANARWSTSPAAPRSAVAS